MKEKFGTRINDAADAKNPITAEMEETGSYLQLFLYRVPKKNHDAIVQNLKQFMLWFKKHGVRIEHCQLGNSETQAAIDSAKESGMDIMDSIAKAISTAEGEEEVWIELQYFRDYKHYEEIYTEMIQDKSIEPLGNEFFGLVTPGKSLITGGFSRLRT
jgi:predicted phosphoadenosine phosphosulfate sulfurtransferase